MLKKFMVYGLSFMVYLLYTIFYIPYTSPAFAQTSTPSAVPVPATVSPTSPLFTDLLLHNTFHSFSCLAIGQSIIGQPCLTYQIQKDAQGAIQSVPVLSQVNLSGGTLGAVSSMIGLVYANPPVRTADYLASVGQGLGIVKEAHAQVVGSGANVLSPILSLWTVSRNISYVIMIIILLIIGLMVMFRQRINPQTVITAQAALPGLVIGLILITFSYFLSALIADTAFIGTNLVGVYFSTAIGNSSSTNLVQDLATSDPSSGRTPNIISIFSRFATVANKEKVSAVLDSFWDDINSDAQRLLTMLSAFISAQITGQATEGFKAIPKVGEGIIAAVQAVAAGATLLNPKATVGALLGLLVTAILLYAMFKLLLRLISAYLQIIFLTITAPFQFLAASLPGRQGIATGWILNMLANVLAFPAVITVFYFVAFILGPSNGSFYPFKISYSGGVTAGTGIVSAAEAQSPVELVGTNTFPLFGGMDLSFIRLLLAFGVLLAAPSIPDIISRTIGRVGVAGQLIGQEISAGISQGRGYGQQFQQGIGSASGQAARARGLFDTPGYRISNIGGEDVIKETYGPGYGSQMGALRRMGLRKGAPKNASGD